MARDYSINRAVCDFIRKNDKKPGNIADKAGIRRDVFSRIINSRRPIYADELVPILTAAGMPLESVIAELTNDEKGA